MKKKSLPLSEVYKLIEPGPVVMLTTCHKDKFNIMSMSWHMMLEFTPPIIACIVSNRNYSFKILKLTKECVINIPTANMAKQVVGCGSVSGQTCDKFKKFKLTPIAAQTVKAPLISECFANLECEIIDSKMINKYNMFILEVKKAWITSPIKSFRTLHHHGHGKFIIDGKSIKLPFKKP